MCLQNRVALPYHHFCEWLDVPNDALCVEIVHHHIQPVALHLGEPSANPLCVRFHIFDEVIDPLVLSMQAVTLGHPPEIPPVLANRAWEPIIIGCDVGKVQHKHLV